jgi:hypothetical protein
MYDAVLRDAVKYGDVVEAAPAGNVDAQVLAVEEGGEIDLFWTRTLDGYFRVWL